MEFPKADPKTARDALRTSLQSAISASVTWLLMNALGMPHTSWAVISAVYVVSHSTGGTLQAAAGRTVGTLIGTAIGIASVWLLGGSDWTALRVGLAALVACAVTTIKPDWRYGIVAATIVSLEPAAAVLDGAIDRTAAILLGSAVGTAAALLVWPERSQTRTRKAIALALGACEELLKMCLKSAKGESHELNEEHRRFLTHIEQAHAAAAVASRRRRDELTGAVQATQRLWHAIIIIDRVVTEDWEVDFGDSEFKDCIREVQQCAADAVAALRRKLSDRNEHLDFASLDRAIGRARRLAERHSQAGSSAQDPVALGAFAFALIEVKRNLHELHQLLDGGAGPQEQRGTGLAAMMRS